MQKAIHFQGLNGLRAIAALAVVFGHTSDSLNLFGLNIIYFGQYADGSQKGFFLAQYGVTLFFALSGFLITYLLLVEKDTSGTINIRNFYIRRILRIWPLYYLYLIISIVTAFYFGKHVDVEMLYAYFFLSANIPLIIGRTIGLLAHYWSLGVEEQFYSFWPWIMKSKNNRLKIIVGIIIFLFGLKGCIRLYDILFNNGGLSIYYEIIHITRFQCMLIGALGALLYYKGISIFIKISTDWKVQFLSWFVLLLIAINKFHIISVFDQEFMAVITVFIIMGQIIVKKRIINLELPFFDFIGKISFGVYVWHPLIIFYMSRMINFNDKSFINYLIIYLTVFSLSIGLSYLSYNFYERKFLSLKKKYSIIHSISSKN